METGALFYYFEENITAIVVGGKWTRQTRAPTVSKVQDRAAEEETRFYNHPFRESQRWPRRNR